VCGALALARSPAVARPAGGSSVGDVSTRGLWERHGGKVSGRGPHRGGGLSTGWREAADAAVTMVRQPTLMSVRSCSSVMSRG
jgi:hypothetical protein